MCGVTGWLDKNSVAAGWRAYLVGMGYVAWVLALVLAGCADKPVRGMRVFGVPLLASLIMVAWDLAMEPDWSTLDRAWIWRDGGGYFGVPFSNFFGWFLTGWLYYQAFALYCRAKPIPEGLSRRGFWLPAILFYAVCGLGNVLILKMADGGYLRHVRSGVFAGDGSPRAAGVAPSK